jgi:hypothetical protein
MKSCNLPFGDFDHFPEKRGGANEILAKSGVSKLEK